MHERGDREVVSEKDLEFARGNKRFRRENRILKEERDILKEGHSLLREAKAMRFRLIEEHCTEFPAARVCHVMDISSRGLSAPIDHDHWKTFDVG